MKKMRNVISINLDKKCKRCGKGGATQAGICMSCIAKGVKAGEFDYILKPLKDKVKKDLGKS